MPSGETDLELEEGLQSLWLLLCTFLVVSMQLGFAMLEVGGVREAHRMTVLAKNIMDSVVTCLVFAATLRFLHLSLVLGPDGHIRFEKELSNWAFSATCATICSGSMAERAHMIAYLVHAGVIGVVVYPLLAEGAWGYDTNFFLYRELHGRFQKNVDYHDCAGSGVVHLSGGCAALAGSMLLGRRIMCKELDEDEECQSDERAESTLKVRRRWDGVQVDNWARRYDDEARDKLEFQHCSYLQVMGMFTLWVGWYGFNAGSVLGASHHHEHAAALVSWNTTLAASAAGLGACLYLYGFHLNLDVGFLCNGVLSGMVAITAPCDVASPAASAVIGLLSGLLVYPACSRAMRWAKLDDPVDAVSVHAGSGLLGVLATAFCTPDCDVLQSVRYPTEAEVRFCSATHTVMEQLEIQLWGAFLIILWSFSVSLAFFSFCAFSERLRGRELSHVRELQELLAPIAMATPQAVDETLIGLRLAALAEKSSLVRCTLKRRGWTHGLPKDVAELQADLAALTTGWRQSALEVDASCVMEAAVTAAFACRPLRALAQLRLRIHPAAELSGLGALKAEGGKLYHALSTAANQIAELRAEHRYVHSPLKRNVKELSLLVKSQDILLRALTRKHSPRRTSTLQSVAEEDERSQRSSQSSSNNTPTKPRPHPEPTVTSSAEAEAAATPQSPAQSSSEPFPLHVVSMRSNSTVSDASLGALSAPQSATGSTPRPTILGRESRESRTRSNDASDVADQLTTLLQTQQQLMSVLAGRTGPEIGHAQFGEPPNPQCDPPQLMQRQLLTAALEVLAARSSGAGSSVDTPRTLDEMMSCGPSRSSFSLGSETASPVRERWAG